MTPLDSLVYSATDSLPTLYVQQQYHLALQLQAPYFFPLPVWSAHPSHLALTLGLASSLEWAQLYEHLSALNSCSKEKNTWSARLCPLLPSTAAGCHHPHAWHICVTESLKFKSRAKHLVGIRAVLPASTSAGLVPAWSLQPYNSHSSPAGWLCSRRNSTTVPHLSLFKCILQSMIYTVCIIHSILLKKHCVHSKLTCDQTYIFSSRKKN